MTTVCCNEEPRLLMEDNFPAHGGPENHKKSPIQVTNKLESARKGFKGNFVVFKLVTRQPHEPGPTADDLRQAAKAAKTDIPTDVILDNASRYFSYRKVTYVEVFMPSANEIAQGATTFISYVESLIKDNDDNTLAVAFHRTGNTEKGRPLIDLNKQLKVKVDVSATEIEKVIGHMAGRWVPMEWLEEQLSKLKDDGETTQCRFGSDGDDIWVNANPTKEAKTNISEYEVRI